MPDFGNSWNLFRHLQKCCNHPNQHNSTQKHNSNKWHCLEALFSDREVQMKKKGLWVGLLLPSNNLCNLLILVNSLKKHKHKLEHKISHSAPFEHKIWHAGNSEHKKSTQWTLNTGLNTGIERKKHTKNKTMFERNSRTITHEQQN